MEPSHYSSDLDPSAVLGFGSALALLDSADEVGRLLTGALRSMGLSDLQAVVLTEAAETAPRVVGSMGANPLSEPMIEELRCLGTELSLDAEEPNSPSRGRIEIDGDDHPAIAEAGICRLSVVRLGTVDNDFGVVVAGRADEMATSPMQVASLQMMAAQVSMALHRIRLNRQREVKEEALRASELRYRELYENAPVAYVSVTGEGEIHMANRRAASLMGAPKEDLIGRTITGFCADTSEATRTARRLTDCIQRGERLYDQEVEVCRADGERIWVSMSVQPVEPSGDREECLVMMADITDRVEMETALREARDELESRVGERTAELEQANERLRKQTERLATLREIDQTILQAESPEEIAAEAIQRAGRILPFRRASITVLDWTAEEAIVLATCENSTLESGTIIPFDNFYLSDRLQAGETEIIPDLEDRSLPDAAKKIRKVGIRSVLCLPMMAEGEVIGVVHIGRSQPDAFDEDDRTVGRELADHLAIALRQSRLLEAVQEQREQLSTLRDIDQAILAAESPEEIASEAIQRARKVIPYESATVTALDWDANRAHMLAAENNMLDAPTTLSLDEIYLSDNLRDGQTEVLSVRDYEPVPEAQKRIREMGLRSVLCLPMVVEGDVIGVIHVGRTRPDAFDEDDREVGRELANRMAIALRQSQLLEEVQEQRERLEERVQERTKELESFTYSVSHDLRTPLRAIDGYTRILKEEHADQLGEEGQDLLDVVYESAQTMNTLIDDLLTLSRLGRREMNRVRVDVAALAREAYDELQRARSGEATEDLLDVQSLPPAVADRSMLRQVFTNLLSNALKFTQEETAPQIVIGAKERTDDTVYFVRDNGVGFDMEYADKLFGVFQRLHDEDEFEGTGVGLAVVERIIRRHGGRIWAEGEEGAGATFFFTLPDPEDA